METHKLDDVLREEKVALTGRRKLLYGEEAAARFDENKFGIAMSGGGIRSATINLGFLRTLNLFKILEKADYVSTVSGGGYTGAYLQTTIKEKNGYDGLFDEDKISYLRSYGNYLIPGQSKLGKLWNTALLTFGFLVSWLMSLLSPAVTLVMAYLLFKAIASLSFLDVRGSILDWNATGNKVMYFLEPALWTIGGILALHLLLNLLMNFSLSVSKFFTKLESFITIVILGYLAVTGIVTLDSSETWSGQQIGMAFLGAAALYVSGFFLNPNSLSFHRFYRKQLADAFLSHTGGKFKNLLLKDVFSMDGAFDRNRDYLAPYPLINTCLNLQNPGGDDKFKGAKASDYFLLSPLFSGSKLSKYVRTAAFSGYKHITLPAALTISAAAVNPGMGIYSNKMLSILMTLFNARLGFWANNPESKPRRFLPAQATHLVWWPSFFFKELLSKIGTGNRKLNISDGGHIENLAVYELLRRRCRLILAVDAGADPGSTFADLENLSIRARNELGIEISFRPGQDPVDIIRPKSSSGYAQKRYAIADLLKIWEEFVMTDDDGQPVTFRIKVKEGKANEEKQVKLEALVNYFYSKTDPSILKFRVDLKARREVDLPGEEFDRWKDKAVELVNEKLRAKQHLPGRDRIKTGTLVYIKSSVTSPRKLFVPEYDQQGEKNPQFDTFKYKIYHPDFPHESTADQFFDPVQWESYYQLGQFIASDVLDTPKAPAEYRRGGQDISIDELIALFDGGESLFKKEERMQGIFDAPEVPAAVEEEELEMARPKAAGREEAAAETESTESSVQQAIADEMAFKI
jgi:Patatin-like phospholipase